MRTHRLAILALGASVLLVSCSSADSRGDLQEVTFTASFVDRQVVDTGDEGGSIGDYVSGYGNLLDESGATIGHFDVNTFITRFDGKAEGRYVSAEYSFGDGRDSFLISGSEAFDPGGIASEDHTLTYAITGGTGTYIGAAGECHVDRQGTNYTVACKVFTHSA